MFGIYGCSQQANQCGYFSAQYPKISLPPAGLSKVPLDLPVIKKASQLVEKCYPKNNYMGFDNKIQIQEALLGKNDEYFIVAQLDGVSDLILVFKANSDGRIVGSYQSSMM
jgi:hypothetical protein